MNDATAGFLSHRAIDPAMPVPTEMPSIEMLAPIDSIYSTILGRSKLSSTVLFNERKFALDGHDCGPGIQDITPGCPLNILHPIMYYTASRKVIFSAATVQANSTAIALSDLSLPLMSCGEPLSLPTTPTLTNRWHACVIEPLLSDLLAGVAAIASAIAVDKVSGAFARRFFPSAPPGTVSVDRFLRDTVSTEARSRALGTYDPAGIAKAVLGGLVDGAVSYARGRLNGTGDWSIKIAVGGPIAGVELSYSRRGTDARGTYGLQAIAGPVVRNDTLNPQGVHKGEWQVPGVTAAREAVSDARSWFRTPSAAPATPALNPRPETARGRR